MNRLFVLGVIWAAAAAAAWGQESSFTQMVKPDDFAAAGLGKLSPAEVARLNQLVEAYKSGALAAARQQAEAAKTAEAAAEVRANQAEAEARAVRMAAEERASQAAADARAAQAAAETRAIQAEADAKAAQAATKKASRGFFSKAKALVTPGTEIEYKKEESRIVGAIKGWGPQTVFVLENGQCWKVANNDHYFNGSVLVNPKVVIEPVRVFGGFQMYIEGIGVVRVRLVGEVPPTTSPSP